MTQLRATDVFTPSDFPEHTYVARDDDRLERRLRDALETPGEVVSISGPSKSGKTVLIEKVVGKDELISVTGAGVSSNDQIWERVLDWMGVPTTVTNQSGSSHGGSVKVEAKGEASLPLVAKGAVSGGGQIQSGGSKSTSSVRSRRGLADVVAEIANSQFVVLIDDFHYMHRQVQTEVAKEIKEAARQGVKICTASGVLFNAASCGKETRQAGRTSGRSGAHQEPRVENSISISFETSGSQSKRQDRSAVNTDGSA